MREAFESYKTDSTLQVLLDPINTNLEIYPKKKDYIRFKDRVEHFYYILEKIIDYQISVDR